MLKYFLRPIPKRAFEVLPRRPTQVFHVPQQNGVDLLEQPSPQSDLARSHGKKAFEDAAWDRVEHLGTWARRAVPEIVIETITSRSDPPTG